MTNDRKPRPLARWLGRFLLVDLLLDKNARPVFIYVVATLLSGAVVYHYVEGWEWLDSLYFAVVTTTTIGYGDLSPKTDLGKLITIFFALNGVAILVLLFDQIRRVRVPGAIAGRTGDEDADS